VISPRRHPANLTLPNDGDYRLGCRSAERQGNLIEVGARIATLERPLEFRQIRYALSVAKERSFTKAATRLNVSQSAVSEQVKMLEEEIGFPLFQRTPRGIEVTERGRTLLYEAERIVGDLLSLADTAQRLRGAPADTVRIGMGSGMAQIFMPRLFAQLRENLRGIRLEIVTAPTRAIFNDLHEERIDAGIAIESAPERVPAGLVFDRLTEAEMVLIAYPEHGLVKSSSPVDIGRLVTEPIVMNELTVGYGPAVLSLFSEIGTRPNILAIADNVETMKVIVQSGKAVAIVPHACVETEVALGLLKAVPTVPECRVGLSLFRRREPLSRRKQSFLIVLRDALKDSKK
jgi:DNA-binding transcriptional LysR family regulator